MSRRRAGFESIDFQDGSFHRELTARVAEIFELYKEGAKEGVIKDKIQTLGEIIHRFTNLSVVFNIDLGYGPAVVVPDLIKNNTLQSEMNRRILGGVDSIGKLRANGGVLKGRVSLKDGTVSGWYEELTSTMYFPADFMSMGLKFTPAEVAAIILHEVGHLFTYLEYLSRMITMNVVLSHISKKWSGYTPNEREVVLKSAKETLNIEDDQIDESSLVTVENSLVIETVFATAGFKQIRSEIGSSLYDVVSFEALSDDFATRHGAGRDLVTALDKLYRSQFALCYRGIAAYLFWEVAKIALLTVFPVIGIFAISLDHEYSNSVYDKPNDRVRRIKNQIVEQLKIRNLPADKKDQLLRDIAVIDDVADKMSDRRSLFTLMLEKVFTFSNVSKRRDSLVLQRELEELAFNSLYARTAELEKMKG